MKKSAITIKDIAKALELSISTVSRALEGSHMVNEKTRIKVREYADLHHFRPNISAQSLRSNKSRCIGVVLCNIPNSFFAEVISGIESIAYDNNYMLVITQNYESYEREVKTLDNLVWRSVDGLIVSLSAETEDMSHFKMLNEQQLPIVFFDRVTDLVNFHQVVCDNAGGAFALTQHLIESGYTRIAHITSPPYVSITKERIEGYRQAHEKHGLALNEAYIKYCAHGGMLLAETETALNELLSMPDPPDAIFTASDRITLECLSLVHKRNLRIPEDIAVAGFSNFAYPELFNPSLTTVKQPAFEMGKTAAELLLKQIESKKAVKEFRKIILPTELIIRNSTGKK